MSKKKVGQDSPIPKFIYLKIRRRDGVESLSLRCPLTAALSVKFQIHFEVTFLCPNKVQSLRKKKHTLNS